ncbi:MAG TPA: hypothetical protein VMI54_24490 [Polyangiaceae bacterium]|nr:hypothetical protein [Polyangiaceae bacterium]
MSLDGGSLFASFVVSGIGFVLFEYGRRMKRPPQVGIGLVLMIFPYFVSNIWAMCGIALGLIVVLWVALMRGM